MSIRGVWQLVKLNVNYCDHSGSSRFIRPFIMNGLTEYAQNHPHAEVTSTVRRGRHPHMTGEFRNGNTKTVNLRNMEMDDITFHLSYMFSEKGKKGGGGGEARTEIHCEQKRSGGVATGDVGRRCGEFGLIRLDETDEQTRGDYSL
eukprot:CAMPEP_0119207648 /NCGR_PEP_ID=MMETSP1327-20130426/91_1 /TAXON_ID=38833 /ORGANISM="Micromonas pusilla, Strain RCC2306" /LENGTH=145 /DNA_ID=CAMNT_0007204057 /DNA_START=154 /DNA_END=590 /DNA_ORIENTATION=+